MNEIKEELKHFTKDYDVPDYIIQEIINRYLKDYSDTRFSRYFYKYVKVTTIPRIKRCNKRYGKILHELCESGTAEFIQDGDLVVFFNWDICEYELIRNFGIIW